MRGLVLTLVVSASAASAQVCYRHPFGNPTLSDGWGSTCCGRTNPHRGLDYPQASGTHIPAVADGTVRLRTFSSCLGNVVVVQHDDGNFSGYAHMLAGSPLSEGTRVAKGQTIGRVGSTGTCTTGPHLHLTIAPTLGGYASGTTYDPNAFINARTTCAPPPCDRTAGLLTFSCDGPQAGQSCVNVAEPADPESWADNFVCTAQPWGLRWSNAGPIDGMRCTNVHESAEAHATAWADNYLCAPRDAPLEFSWSSAGPLAGKTCVQFNEPSDPHSWGDNFLCYTQRSRFSAAGLTFSSAGALEGLACTSVNEPADPNTWNDNFVCATPEAQLGLKWSSAGPIEGMECENFSESAEHAAAAWSDNFLCLPPQSPLGLSFHTAGPLSGQACLRILEWSDLPGSWGDNFLCAVPLTDFSSGELTFSSDGPNEGQRCVSVNEPEDEHGWADDFLCTTLPLALTWSNAGPIDGLDCTAITAPDEPHAGWADDFLCLPRGSSHALTWSRAPLPDESCARFYEADDLEGGWPTGWLCARFVPPDQRTAVIGSPPSPEPAGPEAPADQWGRGGCSIGTGPAFWLLSLAGLRRRRRSLR